MVERWGMPRRCSSGIAAAETAALRSVSGIFGCWGCSRREGKSGRGLPHSKTLRAVLHRSRIPERLGLRHSGSQREQEFFDFFQAGLGVGFGEAGEFAAE